MKNPPCICDEIYGAAFRGEIDADTWTLEYEHKILYGHVASCNHRSPEPQGILSIDPATVRPAKTDVDIANQALQLLFKDALFRDMGYL